MLRNILRMSCLGLLLTSALPLCVAQTLSNCRPAPPMPPNVKPGVGGLSLSNDGKTLVVAGGDGQIRFVEMRSGEVRRTLRGHTNAIYKAIFSPDEKFLASSSRDRTARIWDIASGKEIKKLGGFRCSVKAIVFSPNGLKVAASGNDGMIKIWDVATGDELQSLVHVNSADTDMATYSLAFNHDGRRIFAGNADGTISEWDVGAGKESRILPAHGSGILSMRFSPDYRLLASLSDSVLKLWDTATWREVYNLSMVRMPGMAQHSGAIAFSHDGKLVAASDVALEPKQNTYVYVQALVWDVKTGKKLYTIEGHKFDIDALVFSRDDRFLLTGSVDTTIKFWDMKTGREARVINLQGK